MEGWEIDERVILKICFIILKTKEEIEAYLKKPANKTPVARSSDGILLQAMLRGQNT